jgi:uncharacterized protein
MDTIVLNAIFLVNKFMAEHADVCESHNLQHFLNVLEHARRALTYELLPDNQELAVMLASLLHDLDDRKFFPHHQNYENARWVLKELNTFDVDKELIELVVELISLVSVSKNKNTPCDEDWKLIPRYADRLEAIGNIGIQRCWQYAKTIKLPLFVESTPRVTTHEELKLVATPERFLKYDGNSLSMIDHYYDKLLHITIDSGNRYLDAKEQQRRNVMFEVVFRYGHKGDKFTDQDVH